MKYGRSLTPGITPYLALNCQFVCVCVEIRVEEQRYPGGTCGFRRGLARSHRRGRLVPCGELAVEVSCSPRRQETEKAAEEELLRRDSERAFQGYERWWRSGLGSR